MGLMLRGNVNLFIEIKKDESYSLKYRYLPENNKWINLSVQLSYSKTEQNDTRHEKVTSSFLGTLGNKVG
ncbi:HemR [Pasteurella multocida subsp. multocida str. Anand1_goat]|nr:HemR [Pasteurella multocida subsp. multocida str. Anand1_goat]